jgi:hypothetical protein
MLTRLYVEVGKSNLDYLCLNYETLIDYLLYLLAELKDEMKIVEKEITTTQNGKITYKAKKLSVLTVVYVNEFMFLLSSVKCSNAY